MFVCVCKTSLSDVVHTPTRNSQLPNPSFYYPLSSWRLIIRLGYFSVKMEAEQEDGRQSSLGSHILPISKSKLELLEYAIQEHDHSTLTAVLNSIDDINKYEILTRKQREDNSCN